MMPTMVAMRAGINHVVQELQEKLQLTQFESQHVHTEQSFVINVIRVLLKVEPAAIKIATINRKRTTHLVSFGFVWSSFCSQNEMERMLFLDHE